MTKYVAIVTKPRSSPRMSEDWEQQPPVVQATTVYEPEDGPIDTGLVDQHGTRLYRVKDKIKMGFL